MEKLTVNRDVAAGLDISQMEESLFANKFEDEEEYDPFKADPVRME